MNTRESVFACRGPYVACVIAALSALSAPATAFQHHGPQTRPGQPPAWDIQFPDGVSMVEVPFREVQGMIFIDVKVNGSDPQGLVIESGWSAPSLLITEDVDAFDFDFADDARKKGGGNHGHQMGRLARNVQLELGDLRIEGVNFEVASGADSEFLGMLPENGVLGVRFLENLVVEVDGNRVACGFMIHRPSRPRSMRCRCRSRFGGGSPTQPAKSRSTARLIPSSSSSIPVPQERCCCGPTK